MKLDTYPVTMMILIVTLMLCLRLAGAAEEEESRLVLKIGERSQILWNGTLIAQSGRDGVGGSTTYTISLVSAGGERIPTDQKHTLDVEGNVRTKTYAWGTIEEEYRLDGTRLDVFIAVRNTSEYVFEGVAFSPIEFRFPETPKGWPDHHARMGHGANAPTIAEADFGQGKVVLVNELFDQPVLFGLMWAHNFPHNTYIPVWLATWRWHSGMFMHARHFFGQRSIPPGQSDHFHFSLRFADSGTPTGDMVADVYERYRRIHPPQLDWSDRRPIGSIHFSSSGFGRVASENKYPDNPRGWDFLPNVKTEEGIEAFHSQLLQFARRSVDNLKAANAQGMIVWSLEGQEYPHATSYLGDPRLKVGVTLRPSIPIRRAYDDLVFQFPVPDIAANLSSKIAYAKERWGCTLFYLDSNGDANAPMDVNILRKVQREHPDILIIPEHQDASYYGSSAPFLCLGFNKLSQTPQRYLTIYPKGFSVISIAHYEQIALGDMKSELQAGIKRGDVVMFHCYGDKASFTETLRGWYEEFTSPE